jgi:hypothetical protein
MNLNHVLKKVGRGRDLNRFVCLVFRNPHALGYPKSVTKNLCAHLWVNKSLSMMWIPLAFRPAENESEASNRGLQLRYSYTKIALYTYIQGVPSKSDYVRLNTVRVSNIWISFLRFSRTTSGLVETKFISNWNLKPCNLCLVSRIWICIFFVSFLISKWQIFFLDFLI